MSRTKYLQIKKYVQKIMCGSLDPQHSFDHLERVRKNALKIVRLLDIRNIDFNLLQVICLLHDVPVIMYSKQPAIMHFFERVAVKKYLPVILEDLNIQGNEAEIISDAVYFHNFAIPYKFLNKSGDVYAKLLQDSDSLDFFGLEREKSLAGARDKYLFYYLLSLVSEKFLAYGRKNLAQYLNYPELSEKWNFK